MTSRTHASRASSDVFVFAGSDTSAIDITFQKIGWTGRLNNTSKIPEVVFKR
jgi:hypothetical protein